MTPEVISDAEVISDEGLSCWKQKDLFCAVGKTAMQVTYMNTPKIRMSDRLPAGRPIKVLRRAGK